MAHVAPMVRAALDSSMKVFVTLLHSTVLLVDGDFSTVVVELNLVECRQKFGYLPWGKRPTLAHGAWKKAAFSK